MRGIPQEDDDVREGGNQGENLLERDRGGQVVEQSSKEKKKFLRFLPSENS